MNAVQCNNALLSLSHLIPIPSHLILARHLPFPLSSSFLPSSPSLSLPRHNPLHLSLPPIIPFSLPRPTQTSSNNPQTIKSLPTHIRRHQTHMGNCASNSQEAEGKARSDMIDRQIEEDSKKYKRECKILLLGASPIPSFFFFAKSEFLLSTVPTGRHLRTALLVWMTDVRFARHGTTHPS